METFYTVIGGVLVFVLGQITVRLIVEPIQDFKKSLCVISQTILINLGKISNANADIDCASVIKQCSADIISKSDAVFGYHIVRFLFGLPSHKNIMEASRQLNWLMYVMRSQNNGLETSLNFPVESSKSIKEIGKLLKIQTTYGSI